MKTLEIVLHKGRDVRLSACLQEVDGAFGFSKRPAMLVLPGGGYAMCSDLEADPVALAYAKEGYQTLILHYTCTGKGMWPLPLEDYEEAMELLQSHAEQWHIDTERIAVSGFSAGGHLAACAATIARHKPAAAVLVYPVVLKSALDFCQPNLPVPWQHVNADTAPCFLAAARDDPVVDVTNTLRFATALAEKGIPFETHICSYGGHGFSTALPWISSGSVSARTPNWVEDSIGWLREVMGELTPAGFTDSNPAVRKGGNLSPMLSVNCTLAHLRKQSPEVQALLAPLFAGIEKAAAEKHFPEEALMAAIGGYPVHRLMEAAALSQAVIQEINAALQNIPNQRDGCRSVRDWTDTACIQKGA